MTMLVYPGNLPGIGFTVLKTPEFNTDVQSAPNKYEVRLAQQTNPFWHFTLVYNFLHDYSWGSFTTISELRTLMGFFLGQKGQAGEFLFNDPDDNYVGPALVSGAPNVPLAQLSLVTDGAGNYYSPIQRTFDGNFYEDITDLNGAITVYANGTLATAGSGAGQYSVEGPGLALPGASYGGMYLAWNGEPATPITAQFNFYFRTRFETDSQDFEKFLNQVWTIGGDDSKNGSGMLKLCTARPNPA